MGERTNMEEVARRGVDQALFDNTKGVESRMYVMAGQLFCAAGVACWCFDRSGELKGDTFPTLRDFLTFFRLDGCFDYALEHRKDVRGPMVLTDTLDLMWIAEWYWTGEGPNLLFACGPMFNTKSSLNNVEARLRKMNISLNLQKTLLEKLETVPVLSQANIVQFVKMLHYNLTGMFVAMGGIHYQASYIVAAEREGWEKPTEMNSSRWRELEKIMLRFVKEGNIHGLGIADKVTAFSTTEGYGLGDPKREARNSMVAFTALCARAAMDGGLTPKVARETEAHYVRLIEKSDKLTELMSLKPMILEDFITRVRALQSSPEMSPAIQEVCTYIHNHLTDKLELSTIAREVGYAEYYLTKKFCRETGVRLIDYIKGARIERAKLMLMTGKTIQAIADELQFATRSYFTKVFRDTVGMTPAEYRDSNGRGETQ